MAKKMRRLKTKRGFTMVELLATIVILGVLTAISISSIRRVIENAKTRYYHSQEENITAAARSYAEKNKQYLPKASGQIANIPLEELVKTKYISEVVDYSKNKCSQTDSYVQIFYYENEYYYTPYLKCDDWKSAEITNSESINFTWDITGGANDAKVYFKVEDNENGLASYIYRIYADGKLVFTSDQFEMHKAKFAEKTVNLTEYTPANIKVVLTATSAKGKSATDSREKDYSDGGTTGKPNCEPNPVGASTVWTTGNRKISVKCKDGDTGIGCAREWFTKEFTESVEKDVIKISDKNGNSRNCEVNVYIDKDYPVIVGKVYKRTSTGGKTGDPIATITANNSNPNPVLTVSTAWLNKDNYPYGVYFEMAYSDLSGVKQIQWQWNNSGLKSTSSNVNTWIDQSIVNPVGENAKSSTYTNYLSGEGYRIAKVSMTDQVNHISTITFKVPMDRTAPSCSASGNSTTWVKGSRAITTTFTDALSGLKTASPGKVTFSTTTKTKTYSMEDNAGNKSNCTIDVYVDNTAPKNMTVGKYKWNNNSTTPSSISGLSSYSSGWTDRKIHLNATAATDSESGGVYYQYKTSGATGTNSDKNGSSYNVTQEGTSTVGFRACDKVGNCTSYSDNTIKIEYNKATAPTITGGSDDWTNSKRTIKVSTEATAGSGIQKYQYCYQNSNSSTGCDWKDVGSTSSKKEKDFSTEGDKYVFFRAVSNAGSTSAASNSQHVKVDKTKPNCGTKHDQNTTWTKNDVTPKVDCTDATSGCKKSQYQKTFSSTGTTGSIQIEDKAGNKKDCSVNVYIDKTPPTISVTSQPYANKCSGASGVTAAYKATDGHSGLARVGDYWGYDNTIHSEYTISRGVTYGTGSFTHTHNWSSSCKKSGSSSPSSTLCYKIKISAKDVAGNEATHISSGCSKIGG